MTPDPPWQPKVGDVVAVQATVVERTGEQELDDGGPPIPFFTVRSVATDDEFDAQTPAEIAPWLPAEDHAALLRLRDAAKALDIFTAEDHYDAGEGRCWSCSEDFPCVWVEYGAALAATEHIR